MKQNLWKNTMPEWVTYFQEKLHDFLKDNAPKGKIKLPGKVLAGQLGYSDGSAVSRALVPGTVPPDQFVQRVCSKLPGFEGVLENFFAIKHGSPPNDPKAEDTSKTNNDLLDEKVASVTKLAEEIKELVEEIRRENDTQDEGTPDDGQSA